MCSIGLLVSADVSPAQVSSSGMATEAVARVLLYKSLRNPWKS